MEQKRHEVIMAGLGGKGVLTVGQILAKAAISEYRNVTYFPTYAGQQRGGSVECSVIISKEEIASPLLDQFHTVVIIESSQLKLFEGRTKPGGTLIVESRGLKDKVDRDDIKVINVPSVEIAANVGDILASNFVLLGVYIGKTKVLPPEVVEKEIDKTYVGKKMLLINKRAFQEGVKFALEL